MPAATKITINAARVLRAFLADVGRPHYGYELMKFTGFPSGTLYPILARLERAGWVVSSWEDVDPGEAGRPKRRMYRLSEKGAQAARIELAALSEELRPASLGLPRVRPVRGTS